jgi:hypothetical protein
VFLASEFFSLNEVAMPESAAPEMLGTQPPKSGVYTLKEILTDYISYVSASNQPIFSTIIDYQKVLDDRERAISNWRNIPNEERNKYKNQAQYEAELNIPNPQSEEFIPAKNLHLIRREAQERINSSNILRRLPLDVLDFSNALMELAESVENKDEIRDLYRLRKLTTGSSKNAGITSSEADKLKNCFSQGRELFIAGLNGSLMVKPLNFFYALTAYSYGIVVLNNPLRYRKDMLPGSHGMAYLPDTIQAQFGGDSPRGTFSDLVTAFPTHLVKDKNIEFNIDCTDSLIEFYERRFTVNLGTLLSMIPEMSAYYELTSGKTSRCHPLEITAANDPRTLTWEFHIGDGERRPTSESIEDAFGDFSRAERHGKTVVTVPASKAAKIKACIFTDVRGTLWFIENPFFPIILPEIACHFLITGIFSNIMRYRPDEWGNILLNSVDSATSLATRHYFSSFERKFFVLILRSVSRYLPYAAPS